MISSEIGNTIPALARSAIRLSGRKPKPALQKALTA
jgi:hypothetical protein